MRSEKFSVLRLTWLVLLALCVAVHPAEAKKKAPPKEEPPDTRTMTWNLRDHLHFENSTNIHFRFAVESALWRLETGPETALINDAGFEIYLADNTVLAPMALGKATLDREKFTGDKGSGTVFTSVFPPKDGLVVRQALITYDDRAFAEFQLSVENSGTAPVEIASINPVVIGPGSMKPLSAATTVAAWPMQMEQGALYAKDAAAAMTMFYDPLEGLCLAMGVLPAGNADSGANFQSNGGAWTGAIHSKFTPPVKVAPGAKLSADPVWFSYYTPAPCQVWGFYAWACKAYPVMQAAANPPVAWVTVENGDPGSALLDAAQVWAQAGVRNALVPAGWEGKPGSLAGGAPRYPKDMEKLVGDLRKLKMTPGITVDPLCVEKGDDAWSALSTDGRRWINPTIEAARTASAEHLKPLVDKGFQFFVIEKSQIPDEVLSHFNITRTQAQVGAATILRTIAGTLPVLPASVATLKPDAAAWLTAASGLSALNACGATVGPVRLDATGLTGLNSDLSASLRLFGGVIECTGTPKAGGLEAFAHLFSLPRLSAYPIDVTVPDARAWHGWLACGEGAERYDRVITFQNATPWKLTDLRLDGAPELSVWSMSDGSRINAAEPVTPSGSLTTYCLTRMETHPAFLGARLASGMPFDDVTKVTWNETDKEGTLSGLFGPLAPKDTTAIVTIPEGWAFRSGKAGSNTIPAKGVGEILAFAVPTGRSERFELIFRRGNRPDGEAAALKPPAATDAPAPATETAQDAPAADPSDKDAATPAKADTAQQAGDQPQDSPKADAKDKKDEASKDENDPGAGKRMWRGVKGFAGKLF